MMGRQKQGRNTFNVLSYNPESTSYWLVSMQANTHPIDSGNKAKASGTKVSGRMCHVLLFSLVTFLLHFFNTFDTDFHLKDTAAATQYVCHIFFINRPKLKKHVTLSISAFQQPHNVFVSGARLQPARSCGKYISLFSFKQNDKNNSAINTDLFIS